jgi:hypothetical protein
VNRNKSKEQIDAREESPSVLRERAIASMKEKENRNDDE